MVFSTLCVLEREALCPVLKHGSSVFPAALDHAHARLLAHRACPLSSLLSHAPHLRDGAAASGGGCGVAHDGLAVGVRNGTIVKEECSNSAQLVVRRGSLETWTVCQLQKEFAHVSVRGLGTIPW